MKLRTALLVLAGTALAVRAADMRHNSLKNRYESNYSATWTKINGHDTDITNLKTLLSGLTSAQVDFLASLSPMTAIGGVPMGNDGFSGPNWGTGERAYVNAPIDVINALVPKLQRCGYMQF